MESADFSKQRAVLVTLIAVFLGLLFFDWPGAKLFDPDEARYAEIPREMVQSGDWLTLQLNGSPYYEKPPLLYWLNAASMRVLGVTPYAARLPTRLAAFGTVLLLVFMLPSPTGPPLGLWAALIYISSLFPFTLGRTNLTDGLLSFFLTLTFFSMWRILKRASPRPRILDELVLGTAAALAMLSKGLVALVLPGLVLLSWVALTGAWSKLKAILWSWAPIVFLALSVPIFMLLERRNPGFSHFFFIREHFQRFSTNVHQRTGPFFYFIPVFVGGFLPWTLLFFGSLNPLKRYWRDRAPLDPDWLFFFLWFLIPFLFFSASHSKLPPYILPCFPAAAALVGIWIVREAPSRSWWKGQAIFLLFIAVMGIVLGRNARIVRELSLFPQVAVIAMVMVAGGIAAYVAARKNRTLAVLVTSMTWAGIFVVLLTLVPRLSRSYSSAVFIEKIQADPSAKVVCFKDYAHSLPWELKKNIPVVDFRGELASLGSFGPGLFWTSGEFWRRWQSGERLLVLLPRRGPVFEEFRSQAVTRKSPELLVLAENRRSALVSNHRP